MPRFFTSSPAIFDVAKVSENDLPTEPILSQDYTPPVSAELVTQPCLLAIQPDSGRVWEALPGSVTEDCPFPVAGLEDAWLGIYRDLGETPEPPGPLMRLRIVSYLGRNPDKSPGFAEYEGALKPLDEASSSIELEPSGLGLANLSEKLSSGVDGLVVLAHGTKGDGIVVGPEALGGIQALDLLEPLRKSAGLGHPLRFLLIFACDQRQPFEELLIQLAADGAVHPDFGGILFWGQPETAFGEHFIPCLLGALVNQEDPKPFLEAVRLARRAELDHDKATYPKPINCVYPIAIAFHPNANPLPTGEELELERYWWRLSRLPDVG